MINKAKYVPPKIFHYVFSKTIWESNVDKILLSFDDGPNIETTPLILEKLKENSIRALFFCVGENVKKYPDLVRQIVGEGHIIGNHTYSHSNINLFAKNVDESIGKCSEAIEKITRELPKFFRPPHGQIGLRTEHFMKQNNLKNIMWSLLTYDYKNDINIVKFAVDKYLSKNSIVVLHDSLKSKQIIEESIELIVNKAKRNGYEIGEPLECLK